MLRLGVPDSEEGALLSEIVAQFLQGRGYPVRRIHGFSGPKACSQALTRRQIDLCLEEPAVYALVMLRTRSQMLGISEISDLSRHPILIGGVSYEFLKDPNGWPALAAAYDLAIQPAALERGQTYEALQAGHVDFTDGHTTDAEIQRFGLVALKDDRRVFPIRPIAPSVRRELTRPLASVLAPLGRLLDEATLQRLNVRVKMEKVPIPEVARAFLQEKGLIRAKPRFQFPWISSRK